MPDCLTRRSPLLAGAALVVTAAALLGGVAIESRNGSDTQNLAGWGALGVCIVLLAVPAVGALVAARRPENAVGWLTLGATMAMSLALFGHGLALYELRVVHGSRALGLVSAWLATWLFALGLGLVPLLLAVFPEGRVPVWLRWPVRLGVAAVLAASAAQALAPDHVDGIAPSVAPIANPLGVQALRGPVGVVTAVSAFVLAALFLGAVGNLVHRLVVGSPLERRQLRWLVASLALLPAGMTASAGLSAAGLTGLSDVVIGVAQLGAILGFAVSLGVGVLRAGMFDLREYARRLSLGAVLYGAIAVGFIAVVSLVATLTTSSGAAPTAVAAAVLAVALGPFRGRLHRAVDRLLYGWRSEPFRVLSALGERLADTPSADVALPVIAETIVSSLRVPYARIDLHSGADGLTTLASAGTPVDRLVSVPVMDADVLLGQLVVGQRSMEEPFTSVEMQLLRDLARQAGGAARAALLTAELRAARARLVRNREEERRRLRRELHDGVGPALAGMSLQLDAALQDPVDTPELLASLQRSLRATSKEVRRIAHDLRPGVLDELGLLGAVREQARFLAASASSPLHVDLELPDVAEVPAAVEVAVYRIASEALSNVVQHAQAQTCRIRLCVNGHVELDVADDGVGIGVPSGDGMGLSSMRDRASELGGSFVLAQAQPHGTIVTVRLPVAP
jgi:two-component system NarL family sensor kinase